MKSAVIMIFLFAATIFWGFTSYQEKEHPGKKVFTDSKCQTCHSVEAEGITSKSKKKDIPDLSGVGVKYQANFLEKFLTKKEKIENATHPQAFKGPDAELEQLVEWLNTLKTESGKETGTKDKGQSKTDTSDSKK